MSGGERLWWEEETSRVLGSVSWDRMKQLGDVQLNKPWDDDANRMWRVAITMKNLSDEMVGFWGAKLCSDYPMELYIYGQNEEGLPSGIWILQKINRNAVLTETEEEIMLTELWFVQDERMLAMPIRRGSDEQRDR